MGEEGGSAAVWLVFIVYRGEQLFKAAATVCCVPTWTPSPAVVQMQIYLPGYAI